MSDLRVEHRDAVLVLTLDRPERRNALTPDLRSDLTAALQGAATDPEVRAVVIAGAGHEFCAGGDIVAGSELEFGPGDLARLVREGVQAMVAAVLECPKPVVAAVEGVAAGVGAQLAFSSDFVVAGHGARFVEAFVRRGLMVDGGGTWMLPRLVGVQRAKELLLLGDALPAARAAEMGLVFQVVDDAEVLSAALALAGRLAEGPTVALAAIKRMTNDALSQTRDEAFALEAELVEQVRATYDAEEGLRSFGERRAPRFEGR